MSLSPFSSVATAEWNWGIIRFVSGVVVLGLTSYALKGYGILKDEDPEEVYRREKRYKRKRDEERGIRRYRERIFRERARVIQEVRERLMLYIVEEREEAIRAAGVPNNPAGPLPVNRVDARQPEAAAQPAGNEEAAQADAREPAPVPPVRDAALDPRPPEPEAEEASSVEDDSFS